MARTLTICLAIVILDIVALAAFLALCAMGELFKGICVVAASAALHALFAPTSDERAALLEFLKSLNQGK